MGDDGPGPPTWAVRATCAGCPVRAACLSTSLGLRRTLRHVGGPHHSGALGVRHPSQAMSFSTVKDSLYAVFRSTLRPV